MLAVSGTLAAAEPPADTVLRGGAVYTMDAARSWAEAVALRDGRIVFVGSSAAAAAFVGAKTRVVELAGRMLLPGFQDAHVHPVSGGVELGQCNLNNLETQAEVFAKVKACAAARPDAPWVVGGGWALTTFPATGPTRQMLDALVPDRPVILDAADGHTSWVNTRALKIAGVTAATKDPGDGRIEREASGEPAGALRESAIELVSRLAPPQTAGERLAGLKRAVAMFNSFGITAVQEADAGAGAKGAGARETLAAYRALEQQGGLNLRVVAAIHVDPARGVEQVADMAKLRTEFSSARLRPVAAKIFADGVIESRTASMLEPYTGFPEDRGKTDFPPGKMNAIVAALTEAGFSVHIHAIGDRAIRTSLDAFEKAKPLRQPGQRRMIAHLELIDPADLPRFRDLDVIANFEALWGYADQYIVDLSWPILGPERSRWLYPIHSVAKTGAVLSFGSDWSVSSANPLDAIQVAVTRQGIALPRRAPMVAEEAIDLDTALAAYTIGSAFANALEKDTGSIEVGKAGDLAVIDANLFAVPPSEIAKHKVVMTLLDGRVVFEAK